jgi:hypothetical protein
MSLNVRLLRRVQLSISDPNRVFDMGNWETCIAGHTCNVLAEQHGTFFQTPEPDFYPAASAMFTVTEIVPLGDGKDEIRLKPEMPETTGYRTSWFLKRPHDLKVGESVRIQRGAEIGMVAAEAIGLDEAQTNRLFNQAKWPTPAVPEKEDRSKWPAFLVHLAANPTKTLTDKDIRMAAIRNIDNLIADPESFALGLPPRERPRRLFLEEPPITARTEETLEEPALVA